jgi:hypothetical protein
MLLAVAAASIVAAGMPGRAGASGASTALSTAGTVDIHDTGPSTPATPGPDRDLPEPPASGPPPAVTSGSAVIQTFNHTYSVNGTSYQTTMVGKNPFVAQTNPSATVNVAFVPVTVKVPSLGVTFDPNQPHTCSPDGVPSTLTEQSPLFDVHTYHVAGHTFSSEQYIDFFRNADLFKPIAANNPGYHVKLKLTHIITNIVFDMSTGTLSSQPCGNRLEVSLDSVKNLIINHLFPNQLTPMGIGPNTFVVIMFYDTVMLDSSGNCCIGGFHNFFLNPDFGLLPQTYAVANFDVNGSPTKKDIAALSHEIGEWLNDPYIDNGTPTWGHIGQQSGCQSNLEVGDPLSGHRISVTMPNGVTYHPQELAFTSWFYRRSPSLGVAGLYSSNGTFTTYSAPCT